MLFTFPSRYWFTIGRWRVFSLTRWSSQVPTGFLVSRGTQGTRRSRQNFVYRAVTLYGRPFQAFRLSCQFVTPYDGPYNPAVHARRFGLFRVRSPLLAESLTCFLLLEVLRWFTSLRCLPQPMYSAEDPPVLTEGGYPIRESPGQSLFAAHRGFSQLTTPFIDF